MTDYIDLTRPARYLVQWDRYVQERDPRDWDRAYPRYVEALHHYAWPCSTMREARSHVAALAWESSEAEGRGLTGHAVYRRRPFNVRIDRVTVGVDVDVSRIIARAVKWWRKREAEDRARREERETREKRARLAALKRELGEE